MDSLELRRGAALDAFEMLGWQPLLPRPPLLVLHLQHGPHDTPLPAVRRLPPLEQERRHVIVGGHPTVAQTLDGRRGSESQDGLGGRNSVTRTVCVVCLAPG